MEPLREEIEKELRTIGLRVFNRISGQAPSLFRKSFWAGQMMQWSMSKPHLKKELFRLVDVMPSLETSADIVSHMQLYLSATDIAVGNPIIDRFLRFALNTPPNSLRAKIVASAIRKGVSEMAAQFIAGPTARSAALTLKRLRSQGIAYTIDLLGEYSVSEREALAYLDRYLEALRELKGIHVQHHPIIAQHAADKAPQCISVKLSALYSQTSSLNFRRSVDILSTRLALIFEEAQLHGAYVYVDAEDSGHNEIIYEVLENLLLNRRFALLPLPGLVVQAYNRSSREVVERFINVAKKRGEKIAIRLVKGAYWDYETTVARLNGWESPLFGHKFESDANYEELTALLLENYEFVLPAFASHNIRSLSYACAVANARNIGPSCFELQMLYGMAEPIALAFAAEGYLVRMYVPLGELIPGMGYLVRRLLENTSNESFLKQTFSDARDLEELLTAPQDRTRHLPPT